MTRQTYSVTLENGRQFGPFLLSDLLQAICSERVPLTAVIESQGARCSARDLLASYDPEALSRLCAGNARQGRLDSHVRSRLGSTVAATPQAIANFREKSGH